MTAEQNEILKALHVIQKTCEEHDCDDCPLHRLDDHLDCAVSGKGVIPIDWALKTLDKDNRSWTPFVEEDEA